MAVNDLTFNQVATLLNSIQQQATGQQAITATSTNEFVQAATTTLKTGYDPVLNAISQVLSRTIFSVRPYSAKFKGLERSETAFGNHVRKLSIADKNFVDDDRYKWPVGYDQTQDPAYGTGQSVDQYALRKPNIVQTNFYGNNVYEDYVTIFRDQLENAFRGPDEMGQFFSMVTQNISDKLENGRENMARATLVNLIASIIDEDQKTRVVHLLAEYNAATGLSLTNTTVYQPANFPAFMKWVYARIASISSLMTERSQLFQTVINNAPVMRHTPVNMQKVYLFAPAQYQITSRVLADTYHESFLSTPGVLENVNFWQSIETPDSINVKPVYTGTDGQIKNVLTNVEQSGIFGIIMDEEAAGYALTQNWSSPTPFNARGGYSNLFFHSTMRNWNDVTEKAVVLLLD